MYTRFDPKTNFQAPVPCTYYVQIYRPRMCKTISRVIEMLTI